MCVGLRLDDAGTESLSWADLWAFCYWSPVDSALHNSLNPDHVSVDTLLARSVEHSLRWLVWAKTADGQKGRNVPQQWPLPSDPKPSEDYEAMTPDDMDAFLGWSPRGNKGGGDDG